MKKLILSLVALNLCFPLFAQTFNLGILGGINSNRVTTSTLSGENPYTFSDFRSDAGRGYHLGAFARIGGKKLFLQPEVLYSVKKGTTNLNLSVSNEKYPFTQEMDLKAIQVPLLLGYKLINLKLASLRVFTGPAMSVNLKDSQIKFSGSQTNIDPALYDPAFYDPKYFKDNIWDWWLGGGIDLGGLVFDVHYEWGLTNISEASPTKISFRNKGNTLTFSLGFKFL